MKIKTLIFLTLVVISIITVLAIKKIQPDLLYEERSTWQIGVYESDSPLDPFQPKYGDEVALGVDDIKGISPEFIADPFLVVNNEGWWLFFELLNSNTKQGDIAIAHSLDEGKTWKYKGVVIDESFHLSYPHVFLYKEKYYMLPESFEADELRLYVADEFPFKWRLETVLMKGRFIDPSIFFYKGHWWLFADTSQELKNNTLSLFYSDDLFNGWKEHPKSPIINDNASIARPGGRVVVREDEIIRFAQKCYPYYGIEVNAFIIETLTETDYKEKPNPKNPILKSNGLKWNKTGMHQIDMHLLPTGKWVAVVDGRGKHKFFKWKY